MTNKSESNSRLPKEEYLYGIIEKTRFSRIRAERRLLELDLFVKHANVYYACLTTALTIGSFMLPESRLLSFLSVASAVVLAIWTTYSTTQNYAVRAEMMRGCYLDLQALLFDMDREPSSPMYCNADDAGKRYSEILRRTENHLPKDYLGEANARLFRKTMEHPWAYYAKRGLAYAAPPAIIIAAYFAMRVWHVV